MSNATSHRLRWVTVATRTGDKLHLAEAHAGYALCGARTSYVVPHGTPGQVPCQRCQRESEARDAA